MRNSSGASRRVADSKEVHHSGDLSLERPEVLAEGREDAAKAENHLHPNRESERLMSFP